MFELNWKGLNVPRALAIVGVLLVPAIVLGVIDKEQYLLSAGFGVLLVGLSDPGGEFPYRATRMGLVAVIGALLTALAFGIGAAAWELVVLAAFAVTLLGGLAVKFGLHRFVAALLLNIWFIIAIDLPNSYQADGTTSHTRAQVLAWLAAPALWIAFTGVLWLARGRKPRPAPIPEIPGSTAPRELTRPLILFAVIRALAVAIAVGIAFGLDQPNADWMAIATLVAMKPSLEQSFLVAEQRVAGAILGALVAAVFLLTIDNKHVLELIVLVLAAAAAALRTVNYAIYCAAIAGLVLIADDIPHPTNLTDEARRVLFTLAGVGIAVLVMLLANELQKRASKTTPPGAGTSTGASAPA
ncbi:FUSC family protein [Solirubrobacter soli]|uniref:FUSC family protein n=1 Tax=Solirubrobacter soli TaxID=363832 RepID=UPI0003FFC2D1|nr:FUSC family protein [Solirubrobacter soli]